MTPTEHAASSAKEAPVARLTITSVVRHAEKTGDIPEATDLIDTILTAVIEDMKGQT